MSWRRAPRSIRVRLTLWYLVLLAAALAAFCAFLYVSLSRTLHDDLDRLLEAEAHVALLALDAEQGSIESDSEQIVAEHLPPGLTLGLYDRGGARRFANARPLPALDPPAVLPRVLTGERVTGTVRLDDDAEWRVLAVPVDVEGRVTGMLQVALSERQVEAALLQLQRLMALAVPLTLTVAVAGGLFLAGRALDPIDEITRTASEIGATDDLSRRLGFADGGDEVGRLAATFDRMLDRLEDSFRRQRQFAADASHELRTPLALLATQVDVTLERPRQGAEYQRVLKSLRQDVARMGQLLNGLLTLARADAGEAPLAREQVRMDELAQDVVVAMDPLARARGVRLEAGLAEPVVVEGDQTRLTQLVMNLIDNGLKYTPAGGSVEVSVARRDRSAELRVSDTGVGIPAEHLPRVFDRFYRVDKARSRAEGGAGLGLAVCRWIVGAHGGSIAVERRPAGGTIFVVRLPALPDALRAAEAPRRALGQDSA